MENPVADVVEDDQELTPAEPEYLTDEEREPAVEPASEAGSVSYQGADFDAAGLLC